MQVLETRIAEVKLITPRVIADNRGYFKETWNRKAFAEAGLDLDFVQDNQSRSSRGVLRGLHYQLHQPQGKLVRVLSGSIFDVAVDLRRSSPSFGEWAGAELSAENHAMLWVPAGFAHGFYVTSESAEISYKCTDFYSPGDERTIRWDDPELQIAWPIPPGQSPAVSEKDAQGVPFATADLFP